MYNFSYFKEKDKQAVLDFIEEYPFAVMTGSFASSGEIASQIPILLEERDGEFCILKYTFMTSLYQNLKKMAVIVSQGNDNKKSITFSRRC